MPSRTRKTPKQPPIDLDALPGSALLTGRELSTIARLEAASLARLRASGALKFVALSARSYRYKVSDVREWMASTSRAAA